MKNLTFYILTLTIFLSSCNFNKDDNISNNISHADTLLNLPDSILKKLKELRVKIAKEPKNADLYIQKAKIFLSVNLLDSARANVYQAINLDSSNADYYYLLGDISFLIGKAGVALNSFEKCINLNPEHQEGLLKLAELYLYLRNYQKVYDNCNKVLEINPDNAKAFFIKGIAKKETGDTTNAVKDFMQVIDKDPQYYKAFVELGIIYSIKKKPIALDYLNEALKLNPNSIEALYAIAMFYQETHEYNKAFETYEKILSISPNFKYAYYNMGYIHYQYLNNPSEASKYFTKAINADIKYPEAWYMRGLCREKLGDITNAYADYKKALELRPEYEKAIAGLNRIESMLK